MMEDICIDKNILVFQVYFTENLLESILTLQKKCTVKDHVVVPAPYENPINVSTS